MNPEVAESLNVFLDVGFGVASYLALLTFTLYAAFLYYHWFSYGTNVRTSYISLLVFLCGGVPLVITLFILA